MNKCRVEGSGFLGLGITVQGLGFSPRHIIVYQQLRVHQLGSATGSPRSVSTHDGGVAESKRARASWASRTSATLPKILGTHRTSSLFRSFFGTATSMFLGMKREGGAG